MKIIRSRDVPGSQNTESTFVTVSSVAGRFYLSRTGEGKVLFHEKGNIALNVGKKGEIDIASGKMVFIPPSSGFTIYIREASLFHLFRISIQNHFTESSLPLQWLYDCGKRAGPGLYTQLEAHLKIASFFSCVSGYLEDGLTSHQLYSHKARELLFLMKNYHSREELASFFRPIIGRDHEFADFILANYRSYRTVQELADASCHSLSAFNKLFQKNFNCAPYSWIKQQRANDILFDLTSTNVPVKQVCADHGFGSLSQFTNFCKRHFGYSPRKLREVHGVTENTPPVFKHEL